ncbi:MAG TPA: PIG-L family deacetylase [Solirubrobacteraceae bacterium]|jgi:LmbE family N-acetylglucosaminyl deacetylase|nr:PIG-L family deacetylase [Solirubrobacteraceae bacterium]
MSAGIRQQARGALVRAARRARDAHRERGFQSLLRADPRAGELLLSPHLDDAVLDCWELLDGSGELQVVNVFAGVPNRGNVAAWDAITGARDSGERVRERIEEDRRALALTSRGGEYLPFLDAQYRRGRGAPSVLDLDRAVAGVIARVARVYAPAGIGGHPDHLLTRRYATLLAAAGVPVSLYAELPYCVRHGWPAWVDGSRADPLRDVDAFWAEQLAGVAGMPSLRDARVVRLDDRAAAAKLAAMRCYASQLPALDFAAHGVLSDPAIHRFEVRWELSLAV